MSGETQASIVENGLDFLRRAWLALAIGGAAAGFAIGALGYSGDAKKFPLIVGCLTAVLAIVELIQIRVGRSTAQDDTSVATRGERSRMLQLIVWFLGTVAVLYVTGLLLAAFVSTTAYYFMFIDKKPLWAIGFGLVHSAFIWLAFHVFAGFRLYEGTIW